MKLCPVVAFQIEKILLKYFFAFNRHLHVPNLYNRSLNVYTIETNCLFKKNKNQQAKLAKANLKNPK
jgi:hypothetical protein